MYKVSFFNSERILLLYLFGLLLVSVWALYKATLSTVGIESLFNPVILISFASGQLRSAIVWGQGYTIMNNLLFVVLSFSLYLYYTNYKKIYTLLSTLSFILILVSSILYMARLKFVLASIIILVTFLREKLYHKKIKYIRTLLLIFLLSAFLIILGGIRGIMSKIYLNYTNNSILWSIATFTDYFVSTLMYSSYALADDVSNFNRQSVANRIGTQEMLGYTNTGRLENVYRQFGMYGTLFFAVQGLMYGIVWKFFDRGYNFAKLLYPYFVYSIFEGLRLEPLLLIDFQFILGILIVTYFLFKKVIQNSRSAQISME